MGLRGQTAAKSGVTSIGRKCQRRGGRGRHELLLLWRWWHLHSVGNSHQRRGRGVGTAVARRRLRQLLLHILLHLLALNLLILWIQKGFLFDPWLHQCVFLNFWLQRGRCSNIMFPLSILIVVRMLIILLLVALLWPLVILLFFLWPSISRDRAALKTTHLRKPFILLLHLVITVILLLLLVQLRGLQDLVAKHRETLLFPDPVVVELVLVRHV
mmetsp:Transcript_7904/g.20086  ORF Transcript_7904/g.20086 Transcript_7904/m.20086 type:complete len:214 (+) Transcript_7904:1245-1886(+)